VNGRFDDFKHAVGLEAAHHARLIEAIPERFRQGLRATFEKAEIFRSGR
jgi:hypothetical protein